MKKTYEKPMVIIINKEILGEAYYGAMASGCCTSSQRCG